MGSVALAQISPGPLSRAHESLEGTTKCTTCHKLAAGPSVLKCLECHTEIASRIAARKGAHAFFTQQAPQECARCHSEHNGLDFPIIKWDAKQFDHRQAGYPLEGRHAVLACNRCHAAEHIPAGERAPIKVKNLARTFLGLSTSCASCHKDPHDGRLGAGCQQCHNVNDWKSVAVGQFDHAKTRYPLTGLHVQVKCEKCHTPGSDGKPRYAGIAFAKCSDCHSDPHKGSFPQGCQSCHIMGGWKKISIAGVNERFDHSKTKYPLLGKHATVDCAHCHAGGDFKKPIAFAKCVDCHKDAHDGQFAKHEDGGECASCHTVQGFKPSTYTVENHAKSAYALQGKHATVACSKCHIPSGKTTVFKNLKFAQCTDCHKDEHEKQFVAAPYFNGCERCHTLSGYRPSSFTLVRHKNTRFALTGGHIAVACGDCHKNAEATQPKSEIPYKWKDLACTSCHVDPHKGQFDLRMQQAGAAGKSGGCLTCHTTKKWKELTGFDHSKTNFPLVGAHRAVACADCHKAPNLETSLMHADFKVAPGKCEDCHEDIHGKQFAKNGVTRCAECHNSAKWKPSTFDHDKRTSFPLEGLHRNVRCDGCHKLIKQIENKAVLFYQPTSKECEACHGATVGPLKQGS